MLLALACSSAMAVNLGTRPEAKPEGTVYQGGTRQGGDVVGSATPIAGLPYYDSGITTGYVNDYDEICPYSGSTSPDVVYSFVPGADVAVTVDLCSSSYDTKVYVYQNAVGNLIACNDDAGCGYSGWQSQLQGVSLIAGNTYYIVVDGYGGANGEYVLAVEGFQPCVVECPQGALLEGEPACVDGYWDVYDGGCNSSGWVTINAQSGDCADLCGKSCTYVYGGLSYRDTDWYKVFAVGNGYVSYTLTAEFPSVAILIYGLDCANLQYSYATGAACAPVNLTWYTAPGQEIWLWAGASVYSGLPESDYLIHACGIQGGGTPVQETTWGSIKNNYR